MKKENWRKNEGTHNVSKLSIISITSNFIPEQANQLFKMHSLAKRKRCRRKLILSHCLSSSTVHHVWRTDKLPYPPSQLMVTVCAVLYCAPPRRADSRIQRRSRSRSWVRSKARGVTPSQVILGVTTPKSQVVVKNAFISKNLVKSYTAEVYVVSKSRENRIMYHKAENMQEGYYKKKLITLRDRVR